MYFDTIFSHFLFYVVCQLHMWETIIHFIIIIIIIIIRGLLDPRILQPQYLHGL